MPKSITLTAPVSVIIRLAGLRSRWTIAGAMRVAERVEHLRCRGARLRRRERAEAIAKSSNGLAAHELHHHQQLVVVLSSS